MAKFEVDVKAFISVTVEAPDRGAARAAADLFVENLSPTAHYIQGYSSQLKEFGEAALILEETGSFDVDDDSEVEALVERQFAGPGHLEQTGYLETGEGDLPAIADAYFGHDKA